MALAALHDAHGKRERRRSGRPQPAHAVLAGLGRGSKAAAGDSAAAEGLQTSFLLQPSGNSSALRWKRSRSKWGWGQYENGYNGIKIAAPASPPAGARL